MFIIVISKLDQVVTTVNKWKGKNIQKKQLLYSTVKITVEPLKGNFVHTAEFVVDYRDRQEECVCP